MLNVLVFFRFRNLSFLYLSTRSVHKSIINMRSTIKLLTSLTILSLLASPVTFAQQSEENKSEEMSQQEKDMKADIERMRKEQKAEMEAMRDKQKARMEKQKEKDKNENDDDDNGDN